MKNHDRDDDQTEHLVVGSCEDGIDISKAAFSWGILSTYMKYPEEAAAEPTKIHRKIPTGTRQSRLTGTKTLMA